MNPPTDHYQRPIDYLRVSITDRCNLRCLYCAPSQRPLKLDHDDILRYEELLRLVRVALAMGISKVRLTGGEPLVRRGVVEFCRELSRLAGIESLSLTTNGVLLPRYAEPLYRAGIRRLNISLDTLSPARFHQITGRDLFDQVWAGITAAARAGFSPIKLNVVAMQGINDDELIDLARLTLHRPYHVRFIEFMPVTSDEHQRYLSADQIIERLNEFAPLEPAASLHSNGPARHFRWPQSSGLIGVISPISHHFCSTCNRLRLTADGKLRNCLFSDHEVDIKTPLRRGASDAELTDILRRSIADKPERHPLRPDFFRKCQSRPMRAIGG